jgi:hypothetical protein
MPVADSDPIELNFDRAALVPKDRVHATPLHEQRRRPHGPHGVGTGRADADFEQVENTDSHYCRDSWMCQLQNAKAPGDGAATLKLQSVRNARIIKLLSESHDVSHRRNHAH